MSERRIEPFRREGGEREHSATKAHQKKKAKQLFIAD
jgi:hypothetical protein